MNAALTLVPETCGKCRYAAGRWRSSPLQLP
jgi:hypothetical protein